MKKQDIQKLLLANNLRKTAFRIELLGVFIEIQHGLSFKDIKARVNSTQDKVTIYRTLTTFEKKGLIHKVPDANNVPKYALCSEKVHEHHHAHFICNQCENTFCMGDIELPVFKSIKGYKVKKSKLTLEGDCPDCISNTN